MQHAHAYRVRINAEGTSASEIERLFGELRVHMEQGTRLRMNVVAQVIELSDNAPLEGSWVGTWFKGRLVLAPDLNEQGCDELNGDLHRVGHNEASVPIVHSTLDEVATV